MTKTHIVKSYDDDLKNLQKDLMHMGEKVILQVEKALEALVNLDEALANSVIQEDRVIDDMEHHIDSFAIRMIALRQPVAQDLRAVVAGLKISSYLERMGDYAANIAKRAKGLVDIKKSVPVAALEHIVLHVTAMIRDVLTAYITANLDMAMDVWKRDDKVDQLYVSYLRELLTYMMEDPRHITPCTHLLFIAKNVERIGDHVTNIAEMISFVVTGNPIDAERPKGDTTPFETDPSFGIIGRNETMPLSVSIWIPLLILLIISTIGLVRINEK